MLMFNSRLLRNRYAPQHAPEPTTALAAPGRLSPMLRTIAGNATWLGLIQLLNYGIPILTLPVVARAFGPKTYGVLAVLNAYAAYVGLVVVYGFNLTGPRSVSTQRSDLNAL